MVRVGGRLVIFKQGGDDLKDAIKSYFTNLLIKLNGKINEWLNKGKSNGEMTAEDDTVVNFFKMILIKVLNRVFMECSFDVVSESAVADPLKKAVKDLQKNCYKIGGYMLGGSDTKQNISECWAVLIDKRNGLHEYISGDRLCITSAVGDDIKDAYMIWSATKRNGKVYLLCRQHTLDADGTLTIRFFIGDEQAHELNVDVPEWESFLYGIDDEGIRRRKIKVIKNADNIGFGRYKSPVMCLDGSVYGKPLNNGCGKIEREIQTILKQIKHEFESGERRIFADRSIAKDFDENGKAKHAYKLDEYIYLMQPTMSANGSQQLAVEFSPEFRGSELYNHLVKALEHYQNLMGVSELITCEKSGNNATAYEIKSNNIDNLSLADRIKQAIRTGNEETLKADALYYGVRSDLYTYDETWKDIYEDEQQTLSNNILLYDKGGISQADLIKYWNPTFDDKKVEEKKAEINGEKEQKTNRSIEDMLGQ